MAPRLPPEVVRAGVITLALLGATVLQLLSDTVISAMIAKKGDSLAAAKGVVSTIMNFSFYVLGWLTDGFTQRVGDALGRGHPLLVGAWIRTSLICGVWAGIGTLIAFGPTFTLWLGAFGMTSSDPDYGVSVIWYWTRLLGLPPNLVYNAVQGVLQGLQLPYFIVVNNLFLALVDTGCNYWFLYGVPGSSSSGDGSGDSTAWGNPLGVNIAFIASLVTSLVYITWAPSARALFRWPKAGTVVELRDAAAAGGEEHGGGTGSAALLEDAAAVDLGSGAAPDRLAGGALEPLLPASAAAGSAVLGAPSGGDASSEGPAKAPHPHQHAIAIPWTDSRWRGWIIPPLPRPVLRAFALDAFALMCRSFLVELATFLQPVVAARLGKAALVGLNTVIGEVSKYSVTLPGGLGTAANLMGAFYRGRGAEGVRPLIKLSHWLAGLGWGLGAVFAVVMVASGPDTWCSLFLDTYGGDYPIVLSTLRASWALIIAQQLVSAVLSVYEGSMLASASFTTIRNAVVAGFLLGFAPLLGAAYALDSFPLMLAAKLAYDALRAGMYAWRLHGVLIPRYRAAAVAGLGVDDYEALLAKGEAEGKAGGQAAAEAETMSGGGAGSGGPSAASRAEPVVLQLQELRGPASLQPAPSLR